MSQDRPVVVRFCILHTPSLSAMITCHCGVNVIVTSLASLAWIILLIRSPSQALSPLIRVMISLFPSQFLLPPPEKSYLLEELLECDSSLPSPGSILHCDTLDWD